MIKMRQCQRSLYLFDRNDRNIFHYVRRRMNFKYKSMLRKVVKKKKVKLRS